MIIAYCCGANFFSFLLLDVSENDEDFDERLDGRNQKSLRKSQKERMPPLLSSIGPNTEV